MSLKKIIPFLITGTFFITSCTKPTVKVENVVRKINDVVYIQKLEYDWSKLDRNELIIAGYHEHPFGKEEKPILTLSFRDKSNKFIIYLDKDNDGSVDRYATGEAAKYPRPNIFFDRTNDTEHQFQQYDFEFEQYKKKLSVDEIMELWDSYQKNSEGKTGRDLKLLQKNLETKINALLKGTANTISLF